jgi:hypothetical protein
MCVLGDHFTASLFLFRLRYIVLWRYSKSMWNMRTLLCWISGAFDSLKVQNTEDSPYIMTRKLYIARTKGSQHRLAYMPRRRHLLQHTSQFGIATIRSNGHGQTFSQKHFIYGNCQRKAARNSSTSTRYQSKCRQAVERDRSP